MPSVPAACQTLQDRVQELELQIEAATRLMSGQDLGPGEPFPTPAQKALIGQEIRLLRDELRRADRTLHTCIVANTPPAPADTRPQLQVTGIMVTQSVQDLGHAIRLLRQRPTAVRVFVVSGVENGFIAGAGPNQWPNVTGELLATDPTTGFQTGPIAPLNMGGVMTAPSVTELTIDRGDHSLNFRLPSNAVSGRRLDITARVWVSGHRDEPGGWSAEATISVELLDRVPQEVTPLLIADLARGLPAPTFAEYLAMLREADARLPVPFFKVNPPINVGVGMDLTTINGWASMMAGLATVDLVRLVRRGNVGGMRTGLVAQSGAHPVCGMGIPRVAFNAPTFVSDTSDTCFSHEMGHSHGLNHAICGGNEPWPHDSRLPARTDMVGMHVAKGEVIPRRTSELMSYCANPRWPSRATYDLIYDSPA